MFRLIPIMVLVFIMTAAQAQTPDVPVFDLTGTDHDNINAVIQGPTYLKAINPETADYFGASVAIDGDTAVIGAWGGEDRSNPDAAVTADTGVAYVYVRQDSGWVRQAILAASNAEYNDIFGASVAISGDTIVVGATREDSDGSSPDDNSMEAAGAAYIFVRDGVKLDTAGVPQSQQS